MKKVFLVLLTSGLFVVAANAQDAPPPPPGAKAMPAMSKEERMKMKEKKDAEFAASLKEVGASDEQIGKLKVAQEEAGKKMREIKSNAALSEEQKKVSMKELKDAQEATFKEIVGAEIFKKWKENKKKEKKEEHHDGPKP